MRILFQQFKSNYINKTVKYSLLYIINKILLNWFNFKLINYNFHILYNLNYNISILNIFFEFYNNYYRYFVNEKSVWEEERIEENSISVRKSLNRVDASIAQYTGGYILVIIALN